LFVNYRPLSEHLVQSLPVLHVMNNDVMFNAECRGENFCLTCSHWMKLWRAIYTLQWSLRYRWDQSEKHTW